MPARPATLGRKPSIKPRARLELMRKSWRDLRMMVLRSEPLCRACGCAADQVDHVIPRSVRPDLLLTRSNLQPLCGKCHARKTAEERR